MFYPKRSMTICATAILVMFLAPASVLHGQRQTGDGGPDVRVMARAADFIFKGTVVEAKYRNSEIVPLLDSTGQPIYEENEPVWEDGSNLPHTFVTYQIEKIYKGKAPQGSAGEPLNVLTLQKVGGVDERDPERSIVFVPRYPHMDPGDRDILFVLGNTIRPCPLVRSELGRFRVIVAPGTNAAMLYSDMGREVLHVQSPTQEPEKIALGVAHHYPEIMTYEFGDCDGCTLEKESVDDGDEHSIRGQGDPPPDEVPPGEQFMEGQFDSFLNRIVRETHTQAELDKLPPVVSADIGSAFVAEPYSEDETEEVDPGDSQPRPRPWMAQLPEAERGAIVEAERLEMQMLELNGGNPVLPENECDMKILAEGAMPGDISGPEGKPDCYVDFFDFAAMADVWLECNHPGDPSCL